MNEKVQKLSWWIEILTYKPICLYYFGPFDHFEEAEWYEYGYIQDLESEKAEIIDIQIKKCQPKQLTYYTPSLTFSAYFFSSSITG